MTPARVEEVQARFDADLSSLQRQAHDAREEARQLAEAARQEWDSVFTQPFGAEAFVEVVTD